MENENNEITPESIEISDEQIQELWNKAKVSMSAHSWIQRGTQVICSSCPFNHSFYLEPGQILKGVDEKGMPIIDKVSY
jgi:hypothetical protein